MRFCALMCSMFGCGLRWGMFIDVGVKVRRLLFSICGWLSSIVKKVSMCEWLWFISKF